MNSFANRKFLGNEEFEQLLARAIQETDDSIQVLAGGGLHPAAVSHVREARRLTEEALQSMKGGSSSEIWAREAIGELEKARDDLIES